MGSGMAGRGSLAFINGSVFDGKDFRRGNIVVRDGLVETVDHSEGRPVGLGDVDVVDCSGLTVMPALYDAHMHLFQWGIGRLAVDLSLARSGEDVLKALDMVAEGSGESPIFEETGILWGIDYDDSLFPHPFTTTASELDARFDGRPVLISRVDGHLGFASTAFMEMREGLSEKALDGRLDDRTGLGPLHDFPMDEGTASLALERSRRMLWSLGVVGGVEITSLKKYPYLRDAFKEIGGGLKLTLSLVAGDDEDPVDDALSKAEGYASSSRSAGVERSPPVVFMKAFADGSIGARTASFTCPYLDGSSMDPLMSPKDVARFASDCYSVGLLPMIHAIGDRALDSVIEGMEEQGGIARVEHMEYVRPDQAVSLARSRLIACMQPNFQVRWGGRNGMYESRLGMLRTALNDFRMVSNTGIPLCFGTDLMPPGPLTSVRGATEHPLETARLPLTEVIRNFSSRAVHCSFISGVSGKLSPGSPGDVLVTGPDGTPLLLALGGDVVHRSDVMPN